MFCIKCGAKIAPGIKFCPKCGLRLGEPQGSERAPASAGAAAKPEKPKEAPKPEPPKPVEKKVAEVEPRPVGGRPKIGLILVVVGVVILVVVGLLIFKPWSKEEDSSAGGADNGKGVTPFIPEITKLVGVEKYSSPEKTIETFVKAAKAGDIEAYLDCLTKESREYFENMISQNPGAFTSESLKESVQRMEKDLAKARVLEKTENTARMGIEGQSQTLDFKKEGGNWKVDIMSML